MLVMKPYQPLKQNARPARGASMIEVLIAILVTSIGLLGIAAMQTAALKTASDSYNLTQATIQAVDLGERFWAAACILYKSSDEDAVDAAQQIVTQWLEQPADSLEPERNVSFITPDSFKYDSIDDWEFVTQPDVQFFRSDDGEINSLEFPYRITWSHHETADEEDAFEGFTFSVQLPPRDYPFNPDFCPP